MESRDPSGEHMQLRVKLFDLVMAFSHALDQVHPALAGHHMRVGFLLDNLADRLNLLPDARHKVFLAGVLHDVGVIPLKTSVDDLVFERDRQLHARAGWLFLKDCPPLRHVAGPVHYHHAYWETASEREQEVQDGSLINLADRVDVLLRNNPNFREAVKNTEQNIRKRRTGIFAPHHVEAMVDILYDKPSLDALATAHKHLPAYLRVQYGDVALNPEEIIQFSTLFGHVIDSCSPFTATHSTGVAHTARALGHLSGMEKEDLNTLFVAGMLHDIGKLGVPVALLEKPGPLTDTEFPQVQHHAALSRQWLDAVPGFKTVSLWGALHHERLDGTGYPGHLKADEIPQPSRIMAVADIFTALTEDRPYRSGMKIQEAVSILENMVAKGYLDGDWVELLKKNAEEINQIRSIAQNDARQKFYDLHTACAPGAPDVGNILK